MTFTLTAQSESRLSTCHPDLSNLILQVSKVYPLEVLCGFRGEVEQSAAVASGHSKDPWPTSMHNKHPSLAVDIAPTPYDPLDTHRVTFLAGFVMSTAQRMGLKVRWGGDWAQNLSLTEKFPDLYHFEIHPVAKVSSTGGPVVADSPLG